MSGFSVRMAVPSEVDIVAALRIKMIEEHRGARLDEGFAAANRRWVAACIAQGIMWAWVAEDTEGIAGVVCVRLRDATPRESDPLGKEGYVQNLFVEPHARRRGIGEALMQTLMEWCKANGLSRIALRTTEQARPLYEKLGFVADTAMVYRG